MNFALVLLGMSFDGTVISTTGIEACNWVLIFLSDSFKFILKVLYHEFNLYHVKLSFKKIDHTSQCRWILTESDECGKVQG